MELFQGLILITSIHLLAAASPGPDFVLVSQQTLSNGKRAGLLTSLGIALGLSIHILYSSLGLAVVIASSERLLWAIKLLGAGYLLYLGFQCLRSKPKALSVPERSPTQVSSGKTVIKGVLCNALNPKAPIYFVALFTIVLSPELPFYQLAIYGVWMMLLQFAWFAFVVMLLSRPAINNKFAQFGHWLDRTLGVAMIVMGFKVLASKVN